MVPNILSLSLFLFQTKIHHSASVCTIDTIVLFGRNSERPWEEWGELGCCRSSFCGINHHGMGLPPAAVLPVWSTSCKDMTCESSNSLLIPSSCCVTACLPQQEGQEAGSAACGPGADLESWLKLKLLQRGRRGLEGSSGSFYGLRGTFSCLKALLVVLLLRKTHF